jgi:dTDP-4-dehydrorhamnose 3,5-epimerase
MQKQHRDLPEGVVLHPLKPHADARGSLVEIYRQAWGAGCDAVQFNAVTSRPGVLRGVHVHVRHVDHLVMLTGKMILGLHDLRPWSSTPRASCLVELDAEQPVAAVVPTGVAHGFFFADAALLVYGASHYWDPMDEISCRWDTEELSLDWPVANPTLSERDTAAGGYAEFSDAFLRTWATVHGHLPDGQVR